ncbi:MAG TPA: M28 family peptidase [Kofleriaceae bacterium]|nr:M28 family peptidase [Kofleriaceae bacterium]
MRALFVFLIVFASGRASADPACGDGDPFDVEALRAQVEALAAPSLDGRASGTAGEQVARALIVERLGCLGIAASEQVFTDANGAKTANVIGIVRGSDKPDEVIVVGAHHDHLGDGHLGANDNASGVAGLLAIAGAVMQRETKPARTIAFVTFGAEEQGLVGSTYFVAHPPEELAVENIVQYVNLDMIGSHASKRVVYAFGAFAKQPSSKLLAKLAKTTPKLNVSTGGHSVRGDHYPFCQRRVPYVFFWTPDARCYHARCDKAGNLDYARMADVAQLASGLVTGLADAQTDLAASKQKIGCFGR